MKLFIFLLILQAPFVQADTNLSFLGSFLDSKAYSEFQNEQRQDQRSTQACGVLNRAYFELYGAELNECELFNFKATQVIVASGDRGQLSKTQIYWLNQKIQHLNYLSGVKLNLVSEFAPIRANLVPRSSFALEVQINF